MNKEQELIDRLIDLAFAEDIGDGDHTTLSCIPATAMGKSKLLIKEPGILAGIEVAKEVFRRFDPTMKVEVFMNDGAEGSGVAITPNNGYLLAKQAGKYYSLQFAERLLKKEYIASGSMGTLSHTDAQKNYINSYPSGGEAIGMLIEGSFWENECSDMGYFDAAVKSYGQEWSRADRRFAMMPYPKATAGQVGEKVTLTDSLMSGAFIRGNVEGYEKELALDFLQFLYTDESLREFTQYTGSPKAMNYDIDGVEGISNFARSVFDMKNRADIVYPYSSEPIYADQPASFEPTSFYSTVVNKGAGDVPYTYPSRAIYDQGVTGLEYFNGLSVAMSKSSWDNAYRKYFTIQSKFSSRILLSAVYL